MLLGITGSGKSNRARNLIREYSRKIIVDKCCCDYNQGVIFNDIRELKEFWNRHYKSNFSLIYRPEHFDDELLKTELDTLSGWAMKCKNVAILIEELNVIFDGQKFPKNLNTLIFMGRKFGVELLTVSQRPVGFGQNMLSSTQIFNVFQTNNRDDLNILKGALSDEAIEAIKILEQYHYVEYDLSRAVNERLRIRKDDLIE